MKTQSNKYLTLFLSTLKLSACTFGGGFVIIPLMRKKFVEQLKWIDEQEMLDLVAIAQSSPGAIAVNASVIVGYHIAGAVGALVAVIGTVLPPLAIISVISLFYRAFRDNAIVGLVMKGMLAGVAAVICDVVINMAVGIIKGKRALSILIMLGAFIAAYFFKINIIIIIIFCAIIGVLDMFFLQKKRKDGRRG